MKLIEQSERKCRTDIFRQIDLAFKKYKISDTKKKP
jgi:hypothetical protein